jgi:FAD/FMN-containing dehydrogenase
VISPWTRRIAAVPSRHVDGGVGHQAASSGTDVADGRRRSSVVGQARDPEDLAVVVGQAFRDDLAMVPRASARSRTISAIPVELM